MHVLGMKRTVRTPDGRRFRVGRRWTASWRVDVRKARIKRSDAVDAASDVADVAANVGPKGGGSNLDVPSGGGGGFDAPTGGGGGSGFGAGDLFDIEGLVILALVGVLVLLAVLFFPVLEALIFLVLLVGAIFARVVLRRPWRVEARELNGLGRRATTRATWQVVGYRRSGAVSKEVADGLGSLGRLPERPEGALPL